MLPDASTVFLNFTKKRKNMKKHVEHQLSCLRARELHGVKPMTKCKVHLALRAPMPWKAWSCFQHLIHQLIHSIRSIHPLETYSPPWWITVSQSHGFLLNSNHAVLRRELSASGSACCFAMCADLELPFVLSSTWHLNTFKWAHCQGLYHSKAIRTFFVAALRAKLTCT